MPKMISQPPQIVEVDIPELGEIFADSIDRIFFDGATIRIQFGVTRFDNAGPVKPLSGKRYPVARIVLSANAAFELVNRTQELAAILEQAGVIRREQHSAIGSPKTSAAN
jgi:hypothetical protein